MKRFLTVAVAMLALTGMGQVAMRKLEDLTNTNLVCVTDYGPQVVSLTQRVTGLEGNTNAWSKTVANLASLSNNVASLSSRVDATNALFSAWFAGLQSRTSYWDTAYSWGDWSAAVGANTAAIAVLETNTVTRTEAAGWETGSHAGLATTGDVAAAIAAIPAADAYTVRDSTDTNRWWRFEGTQAVQYALGAEVTNYTVTLSTDFEETAGHTRPAWTNNVWPFSDGFWEGLVLENGDFVINDGNLGTWWGNLPNPDILYPNGEAGSGTATVYQHIYYPTNATGNVLGPVPTNLMSQAQVEAWWATVSPGYATTQALVAAVAPLAPPNAPVLLNPSVSGGLTLRNIMPTNLVLRLVCSNEHIYVEEVYP
jgi:hypothetical protein